MRWSHTVVVASFLVAASAAIGAARPLETRRLRAVVEWDDLYVQITDLADQTPSRAAKLTKAADFALRANPLLSGDLHDVIEVNGMVERAVHTPDQPQALRDAFENLTAALGNITNLVLDDFQEEIDTFVSVNPDKSVKRQLKALDAARTLVGKAAQKKSFAQKAIVLRKALDKVSRVKLFPFVAKARKGDCVGGARIPLQKGESAFGPWAIYDFDSQAVEATYFEANWGGAQVLLNDQGQPRNLALAFGYCDGRNKSITSLNFSIANPAVGTFTLGNSIGAFHRGPGFGINLTSGSTLTITSLNLVDGYVAGTFDFVATNGAGRGTGEFVMRIDK